MRGSMLVLVLTAVMATALAGCADAEERAGQFREQAEELTDRTRFCLAVTRAATAIESGSPATAREAAEEVLAQAPDETVTEARTVVDELRRVLADDGTDLRDPDLQAAAERLRVRTAQLCSSP
jgi:hypothetical protein